MKYVCKGAFGSHMYGTFDASIPTKTDNDKCDGVRGNIVPVKKVKSASASVDTVWMAELWHGPTYCFKDLGQQVLVRLLQYFVMREAETETASQ